MESYSLQSQRMFPLALEHLSYGSFEQHNPVVVQHEGAQFVVTRHSFAPYYTMTSDYWCGSREHELLTDVVWDIKRTMQ